MVNEIFLKITYHGNSNRFNAYLQMPSPTFFVLKKEISMCIFEERQLPVCDLRIYWIDEDKDEVEIVNQRDYDVFLSKSAYRQHIYVTPAVKTGPGENGTDNDPSVFTIHDQVECDSCKVAPIIGFRYKCLQCDNYDLCQRCEAQHKHPDHMMLRVPNEHLMKSLGPWVCGRCNRHQRRSKGHFPFPKPSIGSPEPSGDDEGGAPGPHQADNKDHHHHHNRRHPRRTLRGGILSNIYDMMQDFAEGGGMPKSGEKTESSGDSQKTAKDATKHSKESTSKPEECPDASPPKTSTNPTEDTAKLIHEAAHKYATRAIHEMATKTAYELASKNMQDTYQGLDAKIAHDTALDFSTKPTTGPIYGFGTEGPLKAPYPNAAKNPSEQFAAKLPFMHCAVNCDQDSKTPQKSPYEFPTPGFSTQFDRHTATHESAVRAANEVFRDIAAGCVNSYPLPFAFPEFALPKENEPKSTIIETEKKTFEAGVSPQTPPPTPDSSVPNPNEAKSENSNTKNAATSPVNSVTLENLSNFIDPQYMKAGIQILNNFSEMFAKMLDPADGAGITSSLNSNDDNKGCGHSTTSSSKTSIVSSPSHDSVEKLEKPVENNQNEKPTEDIQQKATTVTLTDEPETTALVADDKTQSIEHRRSLSEDSDWQVITSNDNEWPQTNSIGSVDVTAGTSLQSDGNVVTTSVAAPNVSSSVTVTVTAPSVATNEINYQQLNKDLQAHIVEEQNREQENVEISIFPRNETSHTDEATATSSTTTTSANVPSPQSSDTNSSNRIYHSDKVINDSVHRMMAMGFSNEGAWLTQLLEAVNGNIAEAVDLMPQDRQ